MSHETLGLWGLDPIAERLGVLCSAAFGLRILYHDPASRDPVDFKGEAVDLDRLLAESDFLSLHLPHSAENKGILNAQRLAKLKPTAVVVNTSRGSLIDTIALAQALKKGELAGAGLDVFEVEPLPADHPIRRAPPASSPHARGATSTPPGAIQRRRRRPRPVRRTAVPVPLPDTPAPKNVQVGTAGVPRVQRWLENIHALQASRSGVSMETGIRPSSA
jgi:phosphoglycerate dehydrogenase-like enzyme